MIPIRDIQGRVIGFGGRTLTDEQPKYLNSPETELFDKSKTLFALDKARDAISKHDRAVVVEGYFDAIALHEAGITNVVASLGTALSLDQVRLLLRYTESKQIVLNFDADAAGTAASVRAISEIASLAYKGQVQLRILNIQSGKDADEFLKSRTDAAEQYQHLLTQAPLWLDWQIQQILVNQDLKQADRFQKVAQQMLNLLGKIENPHTRTHYIQHCAQTLSRGDTQLLPRLVENFQRELKKPIVKSTSNERTAPDFSVSSQDKLLEQAEALLLWIYLHYSEYRQAIVDTLEELDLIFILPHHRFLWQQILEIERQKKSDAQPSQLISLLQECVIQFPTQMARVAHLLQLDEKTEQEMLHTPLVIRTAAASMERAMCEKQRRYCVEKLEQLGSSASSDSWQYYHQELYHVQRRIWELDQLRLKFL
jgi:DNA primase